MREIKFRAWHNKAGKMLESGTTRQIFSWKDEGQDIAIMQFTSLYDKNGKEIYEGDVVKCGYGVGKVIFNVGCFMVEWIDDTGADMEFLFSRKGRRGRDSYDEFEVIGNIYENPELLTN